LSEEFEKSAIKTNIEKKENGISFTVHHDQEHDFIYAVFKKKYQQPELSFVIDKNEDSEQTYFRAEVHLSEGGQDYDIMGWSKTAIINDVIDQYHKHLHFLHLINR